MRVVGAEELRAALPMAAAIDALEAAFRDPDPTEVAPLRSTVETPVGSLLVMPAAGRRGVGVKLVTLTQGNPVAGSPLIHAAYVLFDPVTQAPLAVLDGAALTALRTAAVSGLATRHLAAPDAHRLVLFGAGVQAMAHLEAMTTVRPIDEVVVVSRTAASSERLAERARRMGLRATTGAPAAVEHADVVCTCTTATAPVVLGALLPPGAHVNAIGAYEPHAREVDTETIRRARVVVETREVALAEAGDLLVPIAEGAVGAEHVVADLRELVGGAQVRRTPDELTVFVSVGMASEDLAVARAVVEAFA
jgi:ornithine cyclodeaminase